MSTDESVEQGSLRRIREQTRAVDECESLLAKAESHYHDAKAALTAAREAHMQSLRDLRDLSREETIGLPLFPALKDEAPAELEPSEAPPRLATDETTFLSSIGIKADVCTKLGLLDIQTVADLRQVIADNGDPDQIRGFNDLGEKDAKHVLARLRKWDEEHA